MRITRKQMYSALAGAGVLLGATGLANAASGSTPAPEPAPSVDMSSSDGVTEPVDVTDTDNIEDEVEDGVGDNEDEVEDGVGDNEDDVEQNDAEDGGENASENDGYISTVTVADNGSDSSETPDAEASESASLASLATITADEASAAAQQAQSGTVENVVLENENGNVVYSVIVNDGTSTVDVKVDAGNGTVLTIDSDDDAADSD